MFSYLFCSHTFAVLSLDPDTMKFSAHATDRTSNEWPRNSALNLYSSKLIVPIQNKQFRIRSNCSWKFGASPNRHYKMRVMVYRQSSLVLLLYIKQ